MFQADTLVQATFGPRCGVHADHQRASFGHDGVEHMDRHFQRRVHADHQRAHGHDDAGRSACRPLRHNGAQPYARRHSQSSVTLLGRSAASGGSQSMAAIGALRSSSPSRTQIRREMRRLRLHGLEGRLQCAYKRILVLECAPTSKTSTEAAGLSCQVNVESEHLHDDVTPLLGTTIDAVTHHLPATDVCFDTVLMNEASFPHDAGMGSFHFATTDPWTSALDLCGAWFPLRAEASPFRPCAMVSEACMGVDLNEVHTDRAADPLPASIGTPSAGAKRFTCGRKNQAGCCYPPEISATRET